jgi:ribosome biogenesis GTPase
MTPPGRGVRSYDEDDVRVRPGRGSRPRTKVRPAHDAAVEAAVVTVDRGRFGCRLLSGPEAGAPDAPLVMAVKARELGRRGLAVGDVVALVGDVSGRPDTLARVVRREARRTVLRRSADDADPVERVLVANADQLAVVTAVAEPEPNLRFVDRCLVAALDGGLTPMLVVTKADLADPTPLLERLAPLEVPAVVLDRSAPLGSLEARLAGRTTVLVGPSGVGKSTLVNRLVPGSDRATAAVNEVTGRGRHTSSSAVALALPGGRGWVVDLPGVRSFGLAHVDPARVTHAFADLDAGTGECPRGCDHLQDGCALDAWVASGGAAAARLDSLRRLLEARAASDDA